MSATISRFAALKDVGALLEVLSDDERPTFIVELTELGALPAQVVFRNVALDSVVAEAANQAAFDDWVRDSLDQMLLGGKDPQSFCGRLWSSKHFRGTWRLVYGSLEEHKFQSTPCSFKSLTREQPRDVKSSTLIQRSGNSLPVPTSPTLMADLPRHFSKLHRGLADWTLSDPRSPWISFVKNYAWEATPFGAITTWSLDLRRLAVSMMSCPDPRIMFWGSEHAVMYNEAFVPIIGDRHPNSLGLTLLEIEAGGIYDYIKDMAPTVFEQGTHAEMTSKELLFERNGSVEQTFWDIHLLPLPGSDGYCDSVICELTEVTELVLQDQRRAQSADIFESISKAETFPELWSQFLGTLEDNAPDISYAMVYSVFDRSSMTVPDELPTPSDNYVTTPSESVPFTFNSLFQLADSIGVPEITFSQVVNLAVETGATCGLSNVFRAAQKSQEIVTLHNEDLPRELCIQVPGAGPVSSACILPILDLDAQPLAFIVLGIDPRRPYNEHINRLIYYVREAICKYAILISLPDNQRQFQKKFEDTTMALSHQLRLSILKAKKKEERFLRIARSAPLGMYLYSPKNKAIHVNEAYLRMTGTSKESLQRESISGLPWLSTVSEEFLEEAIKEWRQLMTKKTPSAIEYKIRGQDEGEICPRWVSATSFPDLDERGDVVLIHGWLIDISDRKMKEALLAQRLEDALEVKQATEHFLDMVSHEMRNPLSATLQSVDEISETTTRHLSQQDSLPMSIEKVRLIDDAAQTIALCAHHQKGIFDDILTVSKLDSSLLTILPEKVRPSDVMRKALKMYDQETKRSDIKTSVKYNSSFQQHISEYVMLDPNRLLQVLINLLTNAIKFTRSSKERQITITLGASINEPTDEDCHIDFMPPTPKKMGSPLTPNLEQEDRFSAAFELSNSGEELFLHFTVEDSGCGLTEDEMKLLFKRFSQPKTYKQYGGSGLGLYLSKELVELQGGRIGVRSDERVGTSFAFYVKCRRCEDTRNQEPLTPVSPDASYLSPFNSVRKHRPRMSRTEPFDAKELANIRKQAAAGNMHVLVVEDNLINQKVMAKQLRNLGCTVFVANHGLDALDVLSTSSAHRDDGSVPETPRTPLDIVLMDIEMPIMDGLECIRRIRDMEKEGRLTKHLPVIAVTANARSEQIEAALEAGMDDVVTKPFRIPDLMGQMQLLAQGS